MIWLIPKLVKLWNLDREILIKFSHGWGRLYIWSYQSINQCDNVLICCEISWFEYLRIIDHIFLLYWLLSNLTVLHFTKLIEYHIKHLKEVSILWDLSFLQMEGAKVESDWFSKCIFEYFSIFRLFKERDHLLSKEIEQFLGNTKMIMQPTDQFVDHMQWTNGSVYVVPRGRR